MPRTKAVATPGTTPAAADEGVGLAVEAVAPAADVTLADALAMIAELKGQVKALGRTQAAQITGEKIELPDLDAVIKQSPKVTVLTKQGWYVPPVHPTDRIAKV